MKILSATILIACVPLTIASAQFDRDVSYSCTTKAAGGLFYDAATKKWIGAVFRTDDYFVLRLKHLRSGVRTSVIGDETVYDYNVTITKAGSNSPSPCEKHPEKHVTVTEYGLLVCQGADLHEYRFNLRTNRFLSIYLIGYIDGKDTNEDNPGVIGGTCTKID